MVRTPSRDESGLKKGTWTPEEDRKLIAYVTRYGCWNWRQLPKFAGLSRCGKSCRLRWMNYLRPNIKRGNYTKEEEETIIRLHESLGNRWSAIATKLPGRTDNEIKNHWHTTLKKRLKQQKPSQTVTNDEPKQSSHEASSLLETTKPNGSHQENLNTTPLQILDNSSSPSSPQPTTSDQLSSSTTTTTDHTTPATTASNYFDHLITIDDVGLFEACAYEEPRGNFWIEPFVDDNFYMGNDFMAPLLHDANYLSPQYPVFDADLMLCQYGF